MDFVSHLRSLAAEESESIGSFETSTALVQRGTCIKQSMWKVCENQLAEASRQEPPLSATNIVPPTSRSPSPQPPSHQPLQSAINRSGLLRFYPIKPSSIPDPTRVTFEEGTVPTLTPTPPKRQQLRNILKPCPSLSSFLFDHQFWTSSGLKSRNDCNSLRDVITRGDFDPSDLKGVNFEAIEKDLRQTGGSG